MINYHWIGHCKEGTSDKVVIETNDIAGILGGGKFEAEQAAHAGIPGVATGLAWTPVKGRKRSGEGSRNPPAETGARLRGCRP